MNISDEDAGAAVLWSDGLVTLLPEGIPNLSKKGS